jgi:hypothetical protein
MTAPAGTVVVDVQAPLSAADLDALTEQVRRGAADPRAVLVLAVLSGPADAAVVDALARLALVARRHGLALRVRCDEGPLRPLLHLCGLDDVVPDETLSLRPPVCEPPPATRGGPA